MDAIYFYEDNAVIAGVQSSIVPPPSSIVTVGAIEYVVISVTYQVAQDQALESLRRSMIVSVHVRRL